MTEVIKLIAFSLDLIIYVRYILSAFQRSAGSCESLEKNTLHLGNNERCLSRLFCLATLGSKHGYLGGEFLELLVAVSALLSFPLSHQT